MPDCLLVMCVCVCVGWDVCVCSSFPFVKSSCENFWYHVYLKSMQLMPVILLVHLNQGWNLNLPFTMALAHFLFLLATFVFVHLIFSFFSLSVAQTHIQRHIVRFTVHTAHCTYVSRRTQLIPSLYILVPLSVRSFVLLIHSISFCSSALSHKSVFIFVMLNVCDKFVHQNPLARPRC